METRLEPKRNYIPHVFLLALVLPAFAFWAWTEVRGSSNISFHDAVSKQELEETMSLGCSKAQSNNRFYHDCLDQISLFEAATAEAVIQQKPLMIIFGHEGCARCEELEEILNTGVNLSHRSNSSTYRSVADQVLQLRLVRYKPEAREIAKELEVIQRAVAERGRLYAPYIVFYDPLNGATSHVKWNDHSGLDPDRLGVALKRRLDEI
ncbi:MAG: hypothetical protein ACPGVN_09505 [Alphaproteobacteria bacterium]